MKDRFHKIITSTIVKMLRPFVRILLRNGFSYGMFCELAKWVYVDVAYREFTIPGRKQTISRVAVLTGLTRKEVRRLLQIPEPGDLGTSEKYNRIVRVISGWRKDARFLDDEGKPKELPFEGNEGSFSALVRDYSGDMPARAVLDEMLRAGVVEKVDNRIRLLEEAYIVKTEEVEKINILGTDTGELIETIDHNITHPPEEAFLQRKVSYDNIPEEALPEIRKVLHKMGREFLIEIDAILSRYDRDINPFVEGKGRKKAGLAVFYFEGDVQEHKEVRNDK